MTEGHSRALRSKIQSAIEQAQEERKREMFRQRVEIARSGIRQFEQKHIQEAVNLFYTYIRILEDWKRVPENGLTPANFDMQMDIHELLLLSGIYWDLAKLYDRTKTKERYNEFVVYLDKFVIFSKGMPFQALCSESMRKYISNDKAVHKEEFKKAYIRLTGSKCFIATEVMEHLDQGSFERLTRFRDERLMPTPPGRLLVRMYYRLSPMLAAALSKAPQSVRTFVASALDGISRHLGI